jgi:hypothetical protein
MSCGHRVNGPAQANGREGPARGGPPLSAADVAELGPDGDQCVARIRVRELRLRSPHSVATRQQGWCNTTAEPWSPFPRSPPQAAQAGGILQPRGVARCTPARFCGVPSPWAQAPSPALGPSPRVRRASSCAPPEAALWCVTLLACRVTIQNGAVRGCATSGSLWLTPLLLPCSPPSPAAQTVHANLFERAARVFRSYANAILTSAEARGAPPWVVCPGRAQGLAVGLTAPCALVWLPRTRRRCWTRL